MILESTFSSGAVAGDGFPPMRTLMLPPAGDGGCQLGAEQGLGGTAHGHGRRRAKRGPLGGLAFTLLEIMIAITILGAVLTAIYSSWSAIVRAAKVGLDSAARMQRTRMAMRCLVDSLMCAQMFGANWDFYSFDADTSSDFGFLSFVARLPVSFPGSGLFGDQVLRRVTFQVENSQDGRNQLVMYQMPLLAETNSMQKPFQIVLARDISQFTLDFWGSQTNDWSSEWRFTNQIPKLVRVTLGYGKGYASESDDICTRVVAMSSIVVPPAYQNAGGPGGNVPPPGMTGGSNLPPGIATGPPGSRGFRDSQSGGSGRVR